MKDPAIRQCGIFYHINNKKHVISINALITSFLLFYKPPGHKHLYPYHYKCR